MSYQIDTSSRSLQGGERRIAPDGSRRAVLRRIRLVESRCRREAKDDVGRHFQH